MPIRVRARRLVTTAVTVGTVTAGLILPARASAADDAEPLRYAALGDSYAAGSGNLPLDSTAPPLCAQSAVNYAHVVAERTGAQLTDVSCGAAQTKDFTTAQYPGVAPQLNAVDRDTRLVTMGIGGNDNNVFIGAIAACLAAVATHGGNGNPCEQATGNTVKRQITERTYPAVRNALQSVRQKAPRARVAILGYPWIMPATADRSCFAKMPVASGDVPYLRSLQAQLNKVIRQAAQDTGATFVDTSKASDGHDACAPAGTRWIEPALFARNLALIHPNQRGETGMADETLRTLGLG